MHRLSNVAFTTLLLMPTHGPLFIIHAVDEMADREMAVSVR